MRWDDAGSPTLQDRTRLWAGFINPSHIKIIFTGNIAMAMLRYIIYLLEVGWPEPLVYRQLASADFLSRLMKIVIKTAGMWNLRTGSITCWNFLSKQPKTLHYNIFFYFHWWYRYTKCFICEKHHIADWTVLVFIKSIIKTGSLTSLKTHN